LVWFPDNEDGLLEESFLEGLKGLVLTPVPSPSDVLLGEVIQGASYFSEVLDESAIEVSKPKEPP
jgi:hypothetical protein